MTQRFRFVLALAASVAIFIVFSATATYQHRLVETFGLMPVVVVSGLLLFPTGLLLYLLREKQRMIYAYTEIIFGMFYGIYALWSKLQWASLVSVGHSDLAAWTALASSIYIIVRGLDNRKEAK